MSVDCFESEFGWALTLAPGWSRMPGSGRDFVLVPSYPIVFRGPDEAQGNLTWMIAADPIDALAADRFSTLTMTAGPVDLEMARTVANPVFPLIGTLVEAQVAKLPNNKRGLELIERIATAQGGVAKGGYQLLCPLTGAQDEGINFQRLCYYAPAEAFERTLPAVREMARSFHYKQPYVMQPVAKVKFEEDV